MKATKVIVCVGIIVSLLGCASSSEEKAKMEAGYQLAAQQDSVSSSLISSSAAIENKSDTTHKFIRIADLKFKVKSVIRSTYAIEDLVKRQDGFVTYTNLTSHKDYEHQVSISPDSSVELTYYTVSNAIIIRIPTPLLDTTLKEVSRQIDYLDYRVIKADDVALQLLSNKLTQKRVTRNEERLTEAIDNRGKKLRETTVAEGQVLTRQEQADQAKIANMKLQDQLDFSTINLTIYQRQTVKKELIANDENIEEYKPGLGYKLKDAFKFGWTSFEEFLVTLVKLWGFIIFIVIVYLIYRKYRRKNK